jgi:parallel beta-helix repeat protein
MATYYFSTTDGDDSRTSAQAQNSATPWQTLTKLNSFFSSLVAGDSCLLEKGETFLGSITVNKSGTAGNVITIGAYGSGAKPIVSGQTTLSSWSNLGGGIYEATLAAEPKVVTIAGVQYAPGRTPNTGWWNIDSRTAGGTLTSADLAGQPSLVGGKVVIRMLRYVTQKLTITSHSSNTIGYTEAGYDTQQDFGFFITNHASTLDTYGDWHYDGANLEVYFGGGGSSDVIVSSVDNLVVVNNFDYITFSNIDFRYANVRLIQLEDAEHFTVDSCDFKFSGNWAIRGGGTANSSLVITNNTFSYINNDGIALFGGSTDGVTIQYNTFSSIGMISGEGDVNGYRGISITAGGAANGDVSYNIINNIGYVGISGSDLNYLCKNNYITNFCMLMDDGGAVYVQEGTDLANKQITGNIIIGGASDAAAGTDAPGDTIIQVKGIYSDAFNTNTEIDNNTITGCDDGILVNDSTDINVHHNTCYNNRANEITVNQLGILAITGLIVENNKFISASDEAQYPGRCAAYENHCGCMTAVEDFGVMDNNYYARPINDTTTIYSNPTTYYTLAAWVAFSGYDTNSDKSPFAVPDASYIEFGYNATATPTSMPLSGTYWDVEGNIYSGSAPLPPYSSKVLLFKSAANQGSIIPLL